MFAKNEIDAKGQLEQKLYSTPLNFSTILAPEIILLSQQIKQLFTITYDNIANLLSNNGVISYKTVVQPLIDLDLYTTTAKNLCTFPKHTHTDETIREASVKADTELEELMIACDQREDVFQVFRAYETTTYIQEQEQLHEEQKRFFEGIMQNYKRNGLYIDDLAIKIKVTELKQEIARLCIEFNHNVDEENSSFEISAAELTGLPASWFTKERELSAGVYKVTLKYPDLFPILDYANNRAIRQKIFAAYESRCEQENLPILKKILLLRHELANLLQFKTHADFITDISMANNSQTVSSFLNDMNHRFTPILEENLNGLTAFARAKEKDEHFKIQTYDMRYYMRLREEELCAINMEEIRDYFPLDQVINGTFRIYETLLGLKFIPRENSAIWHADIRYFDIYNYDHNQNESGEYIGGLFMDLHPREGKFAHAAAFSLQTRCDISHLTAIPGSKRDAISAMVCNFPKDENIPFDDVVTYFHEFGHIMHFSCSDTFLAAHSADNTETDFVEAPSQMLENWCYQPAALQLLSAHYQNKQPLPQEIMVKLSALDKLHAGYTYKRQLLYGIFDFSIHSLSLDKLDTLDLKQYFNELMASILLLEANNATPASFAHLVSGYDAGYYGYLMSKTYAIDMFATMFQHDPLSAEQGALYRKYILKPGASKDGVDLLRDFLGRDPKIDAFVNQYGIAVASVNEPTRKHGGFFASLDTKRQRSEEVSESIKCGFDA